VMSLVVTVVIMGRLLGPEVAGMTAVAPMVFASVGLVLQPRVGGAVPAAMMANGLLGLIGLVVALAFLSLGATTLGSSAALSLALLICVLWNLLLVGMRHFLRWQSCVLPGHTMVTLLHGSAGCGCRDRAQGAGSNAAQQQAHGQLAQQRRQALMVRGAGQGSASHAAPCWPAIGRKPLVRGKRIGTLDLLAVSHLVPLWVSNQVEEVSVEILATF
jgi:hypothetical protein